LSKFKGWIISALAVCLAPVVFASKIESSEIKHYPSGVTARAAGAGVVDGIVDYKIYSVKRAAENYRPIKRCLVQHGYGVTQPFLEGLRQAGDLFGMDYVHEFAYLYFGQSLIEKLLQTACESVLLPVQESNATSIHEMTLRTERLLQSIVCKYTPPELEHPSGKTQKGCALVGHSKGGAVSFNIARRCMDKTSSMGEASCRQLARIYSATGTIQGAGATALLLGAKLNEKLDRPKSINGFMKDAVLGSLEMASGVFAQTLLKGANIAWDLRSDYIVGTSNPTWADLSPLAPLEGGVPLYVINDIALQKRGWLVADFAGSGTRRKFRGGLFEGISCGTRPAPPEGLDDAVFYTKQIAFCESFGRSLGALHASFLKPVFQSGVESLMKWGRQLHGDSVSDEIAEKIGTALDWDKYQVSDGFADFELTLGSCFKGLTAENSAVRACHTFTNLNHQATAGGAVEARDLIVDFLAKL